MADSANSVIVSYLLYRRIKRRREKRRYWVHPVISTRLLEGDFMLNFARLRQYEEKFFIYYRMSVTSFDELLNCLFPKLQKVDTNMRSAISPCEKLAVTLRYLGTGCTFVELHFIFKLGVSTISSIVKEVCTAIWDSLVQQEMPTFTEQYWMDVTTGFQTNANFPHCLGAIDGKHVRIVKPIKSGSIFYNHKQFFSVVLFGATDSQYRFLYVDVGAFGKDGDPTIFERSTLYQKLLKGELNIPKPTPCNDVAGSPALPYVFVGDEAFSLSQHVVRPYAGKCLPKKKRIFNYRLSRARRYIECDFGILSNKWRIFHKAMNVTLELAVQIIKACIILHNFVRKRDGYCFEEALTVQGFEDLTVDRTNHRVPRDIEFMRGTLAEHFLNEGALPWQDRMV